MRYVAVCVLFVAAAAAAQTPPALIVPPRSTNEVRQPGEPVVSASLTAHGGPVMLAIQSIALRGTSTIGSAQRPIVISGTLNGSLRIDWGNPVNRTLLTTSEGGQDIRGGLLYIRPPHSGAFATSDLFSVLAIRNIQSSGSNRGLVGTVNLGGGNAVRVHAGTDLQQSHYGRAIKDELDLDFNPETRLLAAVHRYGHADQSLDYLFVSSITFADYREVSGILLPFHIQRFLDGRLMETISVTSYEVNPVFDRDFFQLAR